MADGIRPQHEKLGEIAAAQGGCFTVRQARACGFGRALVAYHRRAGRFERVGPGLYRLAWQSASRWSELLAACAAAGGAPASVSHWTALRLHGLEPGATSPIHVTVPRGRRWRRPPPGVVLHTTRRPFGPVDVVEMDGVRVTSPARTIADLAPGLDPERLDEVLDTAVRLDIARRPEILGAALARSERAGRLVRASFRRRRRIYRHPPRPVRQWPGGVIEHT